MNTPTQQTQERITKVEMFTSIVAALANSIVEENFADKGIEEQMSEAIRIAKDAESETPQTDIGKKVREDAIKMIEKYESGELKVRPNQWANDQRNETTNVAVAEVLNLIAEHGPKLIYREDMKKADGEAQMAEFDLVAKKVLDIFTEKNVPLRDDKYVFEQLAYIIGMLQGPVLDSIASRKDEILSRVVGTRNPSTQKFDSAQITYGDLCKSLDVVRETTGGDTEYFIGNDK